MNHNFHISVASDHAGFQLKSELIKSFHSIGESKIIWADLGPTNPDSVDYPDYADKVCQNVQKFWGGGANPARHFGLLICGSGQGMAMRANKYQKIRAALVWNEEVAKLSREHNDANILCLGARNLTLEVASELLKVFLATPFEGGRHQRRVDKVATPAT